MGCYNGTCGLTNLPIMAGAKVKGIILYNTCTPEGGGFCYPNGMYAPIGFPITGKYNDYGSMEKVKDDMAAEITLDVFNSLMHNGSVTVSKFDKAPEIPFKTIGEMVEAVVHAKVKIDHFHNPTRVGLMMVHEEAFRTAVSVGDKYMFSHAASIEKEFNEEVAASLEKIDKFDKTKAGVYETRDLHNDIGKFRFLANDVFRNLVPESLKLGRLDDIPENRSKLAFILTALKEMRRLYVFLSLTRRFFSVQSGAGSQGVDLEAHSDFLKFTAKLAKKVNKY